MGADEGAQQKNTDSAAVTYRAGPGLLSGSQPVCLQGSRFHPKDMPGNF